VPKAVLPCIRDALEQTLESFQAEALTILASAGAGCGLSSARILPTSACPWLSTKARLCQHCHSRNVSRHVHHTSRIPKPIGLRGTAGSGLQHEPQLRMRFRMPIPIELHDSRHCAAAQLPDSKASPNCQSNPSMAIQHGTFLQGAAGGAGRHRGPDHCVWGAQPAGAAHGGGDSRAARGLGGRPAGGAAAAPNHRLRRRRCCGGAAPQSGMPTRSKPLISLLSLRTLCTWQTCGAHLQLFLRTCDSAAAERMPVLEGGSRETACHGAAAWPFVSGAGDTLHRSSNIPAKGCVCACRSPSCRTTGSGCSSSTTSATTASTAGRRVRPRPDTEARLYRKHSRATGLTLHSSHQRKHHAARNRVSSLTAPAQAAEQPMVLRHV